MDKKLTGHVVVVMAPMGSGKGTIIKAGLEAFPEIRTTVSCTTRQARPGEVDGREYHFVSSTEFDKKIMAGEFIEWAHFGLNRYGTLKSEIIPYLENGEVVIAEIEVQGVEQLHQLFPKENITTVYIEAGGWEQLRARALARAEISEEELAKRYERYLIEIESKGSADIVIDNSKEGSAQAENEFVDVLENIFTTIKK
ncbi:MAG: guanylate kinase [Candidatus Paceibacteria bacterium]